MFAAVDRKVLSLVIPVLAAAALFWPAEKASADMTCAVRCQQNPANFDGCMQSCGFSPSIDYTCVNACAAHSGATSGCVKSCSYYPDLNPSEAHADLAPRQNQFLAPDPNGPVYDGPPRAVAANTSKTMMEPTKRPLSPSTNYKALQRCLKNGFMFSYCVSASRY